MNIQVTVTWQIETSWAVVARVTPNETDSTNVVSVSKQLYNSTIPFPSLANAMLLWCLVC